MSVFFNFQSLITSLILIICTCAYVRRLKPELINPYVQGQIIKQKQLLFLIIFNNLLNNLDSEDFLEERQLLEIGQALMFQLCAQQWRFLACLQDDLIKQNLNLQINIFVCTYFIIFSTVSLTIKFLFIIIQLLLIVFQIKLSLFQILIFSLKSKQKQDGVYNTVFYQKQSELILQRNLFQFENKHFILDKSLFIFIFNFIIIVLLQNIKFDIQNEVSLKLLKKHCLELIIQNKKLYKLSALPLIITKCKYIYALYSKSQLIKGRNFVKQKKF
ncbi:transmembrane protein, putative (macronuclear) [Tetrahymena thermophila SB210]|uniref:Transmembrane protein, putative n=1 Tax=Tetrahymena thermophila (strain SB210) TaxID=312017 RepID=W7XEX8_TETTS|nr:transmembrane protein, putative [Tetrahymena thermophila SB210]EWS75313.1 transmembrane protein, putative [Tetrahymena thermophila SB210]|eukprot:XP_012652145.1 transmembrane protein, putative [Tetrahymena thermophila SB210]